ncbi:CHC2 zinc finger domain-containing protein [Planctomycetota bacterium]
MSLASLLDLIGYQPTSRRHDQWRGPCPFLSSQQAEVRLPKQSSHHPLSSNRITQRQDVDQSNRCFSVNVSKHVFRCFCCKRSGNVLDLWAQLTDKPIYHATRDLCQKLSILENSQSQNPT